ncbi:DUF952 domain-containing protein [Novosphingobium album (ex Hu et al. 2023)]|uniref:DUF952 domain-containing protein n=1 Tax=Novosphingobium album (ex Hu et al. 2023) TaxID=2930093 RepID=A0ABT0AY78_9SPHN|nr:DUF952 domain-containing protein [Novosphingobium album (ex Hu et al. 2023)]MCJ2177757.1 DUF952 domain-containing protein [Novosphingobium album (ex Hu et al. 2023)]
MSQTEAVAYKILTREQLQQLLSAGTFEGAPIDLSDGYIHMSTAGQAQETLEKHFAGQTDLHIAAVDLILLGHAVRWEVSRGGALFPHIYADLPLSAIIAHGPVEFDQAGALRLP